LASRLLKEIRIAYAFRQVEQVRELSNLLINLPLREYQIIGQYYLVWCQFRECVCNYTILESIIEQTQTYKSKALIWRAGFDVYKGDSETALYFYKEALKAQPTASDYIVASRGIALVKSMEGFHGSALKDLERLVPLLRHAEPMTYYDVLNSFAVELIEANRLSEAQNVSLAAVSSPFGRYYPEWRETFSEARAKAKRSSMMSVHLPREPEQPARETSEPVGNVFQFPTGQRISDIKAILESSRLSGLSITPLQLLGIILKIVLQDRITEEEIEKICVNYYNTVIDWFPDQVPHELD